ncbi:hypothetical protein IFM12275_67950 [Nocardia sputorum]|uniref:Uncharacterized protein n=1 Tax=Nocardia sputorum TaxID=2984338 RepID=A0ABM8CUB7_9NOCA|nr:hypothetical protein IFM12275_67950 [Nocardia sputorum]BDT98569.1 hypothetical protein IFM12276_15980 [Nocardia sputorum]
MLGEVLLEEIVGESVDIEHRARGLFDGAGGDVAHQRGDHLALTVGIGAERQRALLVVRTEDVGAPAFAIRRSADRFGKRLFVRHATNVLDSVMRRQTTAVHPPPK